MASNRLCELRNILDKLHAQGEKLSWLAADKTISDSSQNQGNLQPMLQGLYRALNYRHVDPPMDLTLRDDSGERLTLRSLTLTANQMRTTAIRSKSQAQTQTQSNTFQQTKQAKASDQSKPSKPVSTRTQTLSDEPDETV
eukprot:TRINITY_DN12563_c0_g1_i4.p1 TRINITY_DN12563_c0_g1~~TRINITY_DN12563_c0_g1_i4.p1  ORF type:complete len:140 (+),score=25.96 TRINITY_DN12563_c0_g1_i4:666-1085(+)